MDEEQGEADEAAGEGSQSLWKLVMSSGVLASMCCLPSVVLVMFGLASVSTAAALSDTLYWGPFRPILYGFTLIFIGVGLTFHKVGSWKISVHVALLCFERMASVWGSGAGRNQGKYGVRHMRRH